ncbi:hypothetical protein K2X96_00705 [Patescibacteria group bacterium]|nr:hypothetical protein [Patescibacteria group bacterium]
MKYEYAMFFLAAMLGMFAWEQYSHTNAQADYVREVSDMSGQMLRETLDLIAVKQLAD